MGEGAAPVRTVVRGMIEAGRAGVVLFLVVVSVLVVADEDDRPVNVNVVVAVVQRVQPGQDDQRGAERAEHQTDPEQRGARERTDRT